jgi:lysophospholipase-1
VREDEEGMEGSVSSIKNVIQDEIDSGIKSSRILLGGFSQGGAMSLLTSLTSNLNLAGIVCLSGWLPLRDKFDDVSDEHSYNHCTVSD